MFTVGHSLVLLMTHTTYSNLVLHLLCLLNFIPKTKTTCSLLFTLIKPLHQLDYQLNPDTGWKIFQWDMVSTIQVFLQFYHSFFTVSGSNNARSVVYTAQMITIYIIYGTVCFNFTTAWMHAVRIQNHSNGFIRCLVGLVSSRPL